MALIYRNSYEDPDTGEVIDVMTTDDYDDDDYDDEADDFRNARRLSRRRGPPRRRSKRPLRPYRPGYPSYYPPPRPPAYGGGRPTVIAPPKPVTTSPDHVSIRKSALVELVPAVGKVWASFLGIPDAPRATGDDIVDRDNAADHRESLARHSQSQVRILALSDLAAKAFKIFAD